MSESGKAADEPVTDVNRPPAQPRGGRSGGTRSRWLLAGAAALIVAAIVLALITAPPNRTLLRLVGLASPVTLTLTRDPTPMTLGHYLRTHRGLPDPLFVDRRTADQVGQMLTFTVLHLEPSVEDRCRLHWTQFDRDRVQPAEESFWRYENVLGWPDGLLPQPGAATAAVDGELWVPLPNPFLDVGWFFIQVRLLCADREVVTGVTDSFRVGLPGRAPPPVGTPLP